MLNCFGGSQTGTPNQIVFFPGAYNDNEPGSTIRACTHRALHISWTTHVEPRIACGPGKSSPGGYSTLSPTVKNFKPKSTSGSDSGAQLNSLSPFNRVSKPQKRDASMSRRGTGNPQRVPSVTYSIITDRMHDINHMLI